MTAKHLATKIGIDPRTLNAIEMGRIRNPSIDRLRALAGGLNLSLTQLLDRYESDSPENFIQGSPAGIFTMDFGAKGYKFISYTPPISEMFCGKLVLKGKRRFEPLQFRDASLIFIQIIYGKLLVTCNGSERPLREGETLLFNGGNSFKFSNPLVRDTSILFIATPTPWGRSFYQKFIPK